MDSINPINPYPYPSLLTMDSTNNKNPFALTTPSAPSNASMEIIHVPDCIFPFYGYQQLPESLPELRFRTQDADNGVIVDPINCCSTSSIGDVGLEDDDDHLFSMFIDLEKLEEQEGNARRKDDVLLNGGGFVVESGDDGDGGKKRRRRRKQDKNLNNKTRKTHKCNMRKTRSGDDGGVLEPRRAILAEELAELWAINPKRAQRIMANRQSAARSKEKKARYTLELEKKVKKLHAKTIELNSQLAINQKAIKDLTAEKSELELQLQTMERQVKLYDTQNKELQLEIERLKTAIGEKDYSDWLNMKMDHMPDSLSNSHLALPQLPTSRQKLLPLPHGTQLRLLSRQPQYLNTAGSQPLTKRNAEKPRWSLGGD